MAYLISITGPTGVGKTAYALRLAQRLQCPIISADSVQIYRGLDVGSGKATVAEQALVRHYMLEIIDPDQQYNAGEFERECTDLLGELFQQHRAVVMVGGTGLYFQAIWHGFDAMPEVDAAVRAALNATLQTEGLPALQAELERVDPETWAVIDRNNPARIIRALEVFRASGMPISAFRSGQSPKRNPWQDIKIGLELPREQLYARIEARVDQMMADGFWQETEAVAARFGWECKGLQSLGYRELVAHHRGEMDLPAAIALIKQNTRRYAKRQFTWFRRYPDLTWFAPDPFDALDAFVDDAMRLV